MSLPPGPPYPMPLSTFGWVQRPGPFMERCQRRYGDVFTLRIAAEGTWVFLTHPDAVKEVFTGDPRLLHAGEGNEILTPLLGRRSVLLLDDAPHLEQRKLLLPPFHGERMRRYGAVMTEVVEREVASWPAGTPLPTLPRMQALTLEIILRTVFGAEEGRGLEELRRALSHIMAEASRPATMFLLALAGPKRALRIPAFRREREAVDAVLYAEIRRRRAAADLAERDDVLSMLLQATHDDGSPMTDEELRDELMTLLIAGHETTATALAWALERLVRAPDKLERLASGDDAYTEAVVKETLRLRPVIPVVLRQLVEPMEIAGHRLPAGVKVAPCIYLVHRRADVYPDPERFEPERFLGRSPGTYTWLPFGGGVRRCIGASFAMFEMQVALDVIARRLRLRPDDPAPERIARRTITLTPSRGGTVVPTPAAPSA